MCVCLCVTLNDIWSVSYHCFMMCGCVCVGVWELGSTGTWVVSVWVGYVCVDGVCACICGCASA